MIPPSPFTPFLSLSKNSSFLFSPSSPPSSICSDIFRFLVCLYLRSAIYERITFSLGGISQSIIFFLPCVSGRPSCRNQLSVPFFIPQPLYLFQSHQVTVFSCFFSALFSFGRDSNKTEPPDGDVCFYRMMNLLVFPSIPSVLPFLYPPYITFVALDK